MKDNRELTINFIAMAIAFITNAAINFLLSRYIVNSVSEEAYGFIQLTNTFITYFTVLTIAINSMASRFIAMEYYKGNIKEANGYYKSTLFANVIIIAITAPVLILTILNIESLVQISPELVVDVKMLLIFLAGNLYLGLISTNISISYYVKNKLYIQSIINTASYILKALLLILLYKLFPPYVSIFGLITLLSTAFIQLLNIYYKNKLIPEIELKNAKVEYKKIKTLISSGIWNSITRIGNILSEGLDLLLANLYIGPEEMGILAIVKTIPSMVGSALNSLVSVFMPNMTKLYAEDKKENFIVYIKKAMKIVGMFLNLPIICIIVLGDVLFSLWFPTQNSILLQILSIISISQWIIIGPISIMHNVFTVVNKIKVNAILVCITGLLNMLTVYILLNVTSYGLYIITGVSCIYSILRNLLYTLPFGAKSIGAMWDTFFPEIGRSLLAVIINVLVGYGIRMIIRPDSWIGLIICGCMVCIVGLIINVFIIFSNEEKMAIHKKVINIIKADNIGKD